LSPWRSEFDDGLGWNLDLLLRLGIEERSASPFNWLFTRHDLHALLVKISAKRLAPAA
jgi:hypothetical protein